MVWCHRLRAFVRQPITFDTLSGALRIATKYEIPALREWSVNELRSRWPTMLVNMVPAKTLPHAAGMPHFPLLHLPIQVKI